MPDAPTIIQELITRFADNSEQYRADDYKEARVRTEFIDPFFAALGWDIANRQGYAEAYKEVVREDTIKIGGTIKAPDYCFRIGGTRKFFVEAKKPGAYIKAEIDPAFQLRRYAWSAKLSLSILTNFDEFAVYDCRIRPQQTDAASTARILYCNSSDYGERWGEIAGIFSRDAVLKGSFDRFVESTKRKRGTAEVDDAFLDEIETWRFRLARDIALRNPRLTQGELNFAVQATINRIIFLRICEDRGIEQYGRLALLPAEKHMYRRLLHYFQQADDRYNSGLFYFRREKGRPTPDELTPRLTIDNKPLKQIIGELYYPDSPYEFAVLPADILGQVYEQFLGKVIRLTGGHHAVVEDKPEVAKAGGVFYTPTYIVDYIVTHTVRPLLDGKTPRQVAQLRILDPACGSGSFLIAVYQCMLDWHRDHYVADGPEKHRTQLYQGAGGAWRLTARERKRILLNNIYGVDIDSQAVEVTKLSLLLKVLEGENEQSVGTSLRMFHERALPDLVSNIRCGNSLIDPQGMSEHLLDEPSSEDRDRINAFDWRTEFPRIMRAGGFDAIVGNPPYIRVQVMTEWAPVEVDYYKRRYMAASKGNYDIYVVFIERALELLNPHGQLGFIVPHKFFNAQYGQPLRRMLAARQQLLHIVHFGDQQVFGRSTTYTCLLLLAKRPTPECRFVQVRDLDNWRAEQRGIEGNIPASSITDAEWNFTVGSAAALFRKLQAMPTMLTDVTTRIFQGIKTSADKIYIVEQRERVHGRVRVYSAQTDQEHWLEPDLLHPLIKGGDSRRYHLSRTARLILFPYATTSVNGRVGLIEQRVLAEQYPLTWHYLKANKRYLEDRERGRMRGSQWYGYIYPKALDVMPLPKIFTPDLALHASFSLDETGEVFFTGGVAGGYGILVRPEVSREYILGLLNSALLEWFIRHSATPMRGGYYSYEARFIRHLPIRLVDLTNADDRRCHDRIEILVQRALALHQAVGGTPHEQERIRRDALACDREIDQMVYDLYAVTDAEREVVEATFAASAKERT